MTVRKDFIPKTLQDFLVTTFVSIIIPIVYWFELFEVLPSFYTQWNGWYTFHFILGTFILFNITTNFIGVILTDTSIKGLMLPAKLQKNWRFCAVCECIAPPRSWHCNICKTCILKRDHHCIFTGCCIGHRNLRYFLMFVIYMFVATLYASYYNIFYIYNSVELSSFMSILKLIFPLAMIFVEYTMNQLFLFLVLIVTVGCVFTGVLFYFHTNLILNGMITYERKFKDRFYDLGRLENVKVCLGERWYLTWISPFVESELRHDGVNWIARDTCKSK